MLQLSSREGIRCISILLCLLILSVENLSSIERGLHSLSMNSATSVSQFTWVYCMQSWTFLWNRETIQIPSLMLYRTIRNSVPLHIHFLPFVLSANNNYYKFTLKKTVAYISTLSHMHINTTHGSVYIICTHTSICKHTHKDHQWTTEFAKRKQGKISKFRNRKKLIIDFEIRHLASFTFSSFVVILFLALWSFLPVLSYLEGDGLLEDLFQSGYSQKMIWLVYIDRKNNFESKWLKRTRLK